MLILSKDGISTTYFSVKFSKKSINTIIKVIMTFTNTKQLAKIIYNKNKKVINIIDIRKD